MSQQIVDPWPNNDPRDLKDKKNTCRMIGAVKIESKVNVYVIVATPSIDIKWNKALQYEELKETYCQTS